MIKAVIYDLDDLMVDSNALHKKAHRQVFEQYDINPDNISDELKSKFIGMRIIDILKIIVEEFDLTVDPDEIRHQREKIFLKLVQNELAMMPGLIESLIFFKNHDFKIALASSGTKVYIEIVLAKFNLNHFFDVIVSGDDVIKGKPDPETFLIAAKKLQLPAAECLVLEDATNGILAAKVAGCQCFAIRNNKTAKQNLTKADRILNSLLEINSQIIDSL